MQNTYKYLLFDLDGTLTDPAEGITRAVQHALKKQGIHVADRKTLLPFIGPPLQQSFQDFYGFTPQQAAEACEAYNDYSPPKGIFENRPYKGIHAFLRQLRDEGRTLLVATSKPEILAKRILEHFGLLPYFDFVGGDTMERTRSDKAEVIRYVLQAAGITTKEKRAAVMIGDRKHDIIGARSNGIDSIGVLYGYGNKEELTQAGATFIAPSLSSVGQFIKGKAGIP